LAGADLPPAQGVMLLAAHISRALTLTEWTDPSVLDEDKPFERDIELNLYDKRNPNKPPYSAEYVARFREAQIARNRRITARVKAQLAALKADGRAHEERCFTVQGTMADPRWLDPAIDPNGREPGTTYLGDPVIANDGPVGLARFTTLRSWLSQWSYDESRANGVKNAANITCPALVLNNTADQACTPSHAERLFAALAPKDKERHDVQDADHYYIARPDKLKEATAIVTDWLDRKGL
ncbi:MAG: alpha/beta hydrolase family protein, partial [Hyphomonadaceae bacterium]